MERGDMKEGGRSERKAGEDEGGREEGKECETA